MLANKRGLTFQNVYLLSIAYKQTMLDHIPITKMVDFFHDHSKSY